MFRRLRLLRRCEFIVRVTDPEAGREYPPQIVRRALAAAAAAAALVPCATAALAAAGTDGTHTLVVTVRKTLPPAAEKKLAVLVLITRDGGAPAGAVATASRPLTVLQRDSGLYRVKVVIDVACKGTCAATYRISASANHRLEVVPSCWPAGAGFVCSRLRIVKAY